MEKSKFQVEIFFLTANLEDYMNKVPFDIAITNEHNIFSEVAEMPLKISKLRKKPEFAKRKDEKGKWKKMELTKFRKFSMFNSLMEVRHN